MRGEHSVHVRLRPYPKGMSFGGEEHSDLNSLASCLSFTILVSIKSLSRNPVCEMNYFCVPRQIPDVESIIPFAPAASSLKHSIPIGNSVLIKPRVTHSFVQSSLWSREIETIHEFRIVYVFDAIRHT